MKNIFILMTIMLSACSTYQQHFGGKSSKYECAKSNETLQYPNGITHLTPNDRYEIPKVVDQTSSKSPVDSTPPDFD